MSLNCLCHALDRTTSVYQERKRRLEQGHEKRHLMVKRAARNWSGNLIRSGFLQMHGTDDQGDFMIERATKTARKGHRRGGSLVNEPRLVRSSGMRRDWSFEDLKQHGKQIFQ
ncbi:hypothetical protein QQ045_006668 [Rhodiola kirilowii]